MKGVFDFRLGSPFNDRLGERYHFPLDSDYLEVARAVAGDWVIFRETRRDGGRQAYVGAARVVSIERDPADPGYAYALVADFFAFAPPVPFAEDGRYWEAGLRGVADRRLIGRTLQGRSLRPIADADFAAIVAAGVGPTMAPDNLVRYGPGVGEEPAPPLEGYPEPHGAGFVRRVEQVLLNRKVRDANFRRLVCQAYDDTCAITGLKIINGGGRSEVQAAHIWPVQDGGPDVVQNGIALSATVHWLFDRHLISLTDDYRLLVSHNKVPAELRGLFERHADRILVPEAAALRPHPAYLRRHRERFSAA